MTEFQSVPPLSTPTSSHLRYIKAILVCVLPTALTTPLHEWLDPVNTAMVYLLAVVCVAMIWGRGPAVLSAFLSVGLFDFFYIPPRLSFAVSDIQYLLTFAVMLVVGLLITHLTSGLRERAEQADEAAASANALYALARQLAGTMSVEQVLLALQSHAQEILDADALLMLPDRTEQLSPLIGSKQITCNSSLTTMALACFKDGHPILTHQLDDNGAAVTLLPLHGSTRSRGVLILSARSHRQTLDEQRPMLDAIATLTATALERLHFVEIAHQTQLDISTANLRSSILAALSHDIRTPLTSLYGMADALTIQSPPLPGLAQEMAQSIRDQAMRMHRMVSNLLDMARLQQNQGQVVLRLEWQPIEEVIGASIQLLGQALAQHDVKVVLDPELPLINIDAVLMERVFGNLLENASKYAPLGTQIRVQVHASETNVFVSVCNAGTGFPPDRIDKVFELFERGVTESTIPGVGLGLTLCKVIIEAHGGQIRVRNLDEGGAEVSFNIPRGKPPLVDPDLIERGIA